MCQTNRMDVDIDLHFVIIKKRKRKSNVCLYIRTSCQLSCLFNRLEGNNVNQHKCSLIATIILDASVVRQERTGYYQIQLDSGYFKENGDCIIFLSSSLISRVKNLAFPFCAPPHLQILFCKLYRIFIYS
jgi:hypothetical protein